MTVALCCSTCSSRAAHAARSRANGCCCSTSRHSPMACSKRVLLQPAPRERVERQHASRAGDTGRVEHSLPAPRDVRLASRVGARAELVEQHERGLAEPFEDAQLGRDVAGRLRVLRRVRDVKHDVRRIPRGAHRLLAAPERAVREAVPHLRQEPPDRPSALLEPPQRDARCRRSRACPRARVRRPPPCAAARATRPSR